MSAMYVDIHANIYVTYIPVLYCRLCQKKLRQGKEDYKVAKISYLLPLPHK